MLPLPKAKLAIVAVLFGSLLLAACMFSPGKFDSLLDIRRDGRFSFTYTGEMHFMALSQLAKAGEKSATFVAEPCLDEDSGDVRTCSTAEIAEQRETWELERKAKEENDKREAESMKAILGDLDMSDPRTGEELAQRLRRQAGWQRVDYRGDGLFDVDFRLSGTLDHDFAFPTIEQFPLGNSFVQVSLRADGSVRIDAPAFGPNTGAGMMSSLGAFAGPGSNSDLSKIPVPDGRFALVTDAPILANNTDEGPRAVPVGQQLDWTVNARSKAAPMALVRLDAR